MHEIIPSPGTEDKEFSEIKKKIELVKPFARTVHIDILDGKFAPNTTFSDPEPFKKYTKDLPAGRQGLSFEVHLMVEDPVKHLKKWADAGFRRFIGQIEKMSDQAEFVAEAQLLGEAGLALDLQTPVDSLKIPIDDLDTLLIMTVQAGFSGQAFQEQAIEKVKTLVEKTEVPIEVDGGVNDETILVAEASGAKRFVATSFLFSLGTPQEQYQMLQKKLQELAPQK